MMVAKRALFIPLIVQYACSIRFCVQPRHCDHPVAHVSRGPRSLQLRHIQEKPQSESALKLNINYFFFFSTLIAFPYFCPVLYP